MSDEFAPDAEVTSLRQQYLSLLPATRPQLDDQFGTFTAGDLIAWGKRTKRSTFDRQSYQYIEDPKGPRS